MRIALFQPDIPQNTAAVLRLAACLGVAVEIVEPCGFALSDKSIKRVGMDYLGKVDLTRHRNWETFRADRPERLVLLTTKAKTAYTEFAFAPDDILLLGRESAGVPGDIHNSADARLRIPMAPGLRSLNVAMAAAMVLAEALRQTDAFPRGD